MESVREFAKNVQKKFPAIHILINNGKTLEALSTKIFQPSWAHFSWRDGNAI